MIHNITPIIKKSIALKVDKMSVVQVSVYVCMCLCAYSCLEGERECLQSMAKVQQSNSFRKEAVSEPGGLTPDAPYVHFLIVRM